MKLLIHPIPPDLVPSYQDRAIQSLVQQYAFQRIDQSFLTPANIEGYAKSITSKLAELDNQARPFFRSVIGQAASLQRIASDPWNEAQDRMFVDLYVIHKLLQQSNTEDAVRGEITKDRFVQTKGAILKIVNELKLFQFLRSNPEYQDAKFVNFGAALNETDMRPPAVVDNAVRLLELPPRARQLQSKRDVGMTGTRVTVEHLGGGRTAGRNDEFAPDNILDANPASFWAEMIMAESPIVQDYASSGDAGLGSTFESRGAICHVYLNFASTATANTLRLLPFGDFPVRVIDIAYKEATGQTQWTKLPNFTVEPATLDWIEVNFEPQPISALRITIEQTNHRLNTYHLPERLVRNGLIWQQIGRSRKSETFTDMQLTDREADIIQADPQQIISLQAIDDFRDLMDAESIRAGREFQVEAVKRTANAAANAVSKLDPSAANEVLSITEGTQADPTQKIVSIQVYEYIYGLRDVQLQYNLYQPVAHYSSQKFRSGASILEASLTTEERHLTFNDGLGDFAKTSVEWDIEVGRDKRYPIAPKNWRRNGVIEVPDEYMQFDRITKQAVSRLSASTKVVTLRKNGVRVPVGAIDVQYYTPGVRNELPILLPMGVASPSFGGLADTAVVRQNLLLVTIKDPAWYDPNAVYTMRYVAAEKATNINIDSDLNSVELSKPEVFDRTSRDNQLVLKAFPYVDYSLINSDSWVQVGSEAKWTFAPLLQNYLTGTIQVTNGSATVIGAGLNWSTFASHASKLALKVIGETGIYRVQSISSGTQLNLKNAYQGTTGSGKTYALGFVHESDGKVYAFERNVYEPLKVFVNDVRATNLTDYEAFQHQAFTDVPRSGRQIQFIHSGNLLYFNRPIENAKIEVYYSWLTEYIRVNATLRCNIPVRTVLTPQVNSFRVELKTSKL